MRQADIRGEISPGTSAYVIASREFPSSRQDFRSTPICGGPILRPGKLHGRSRAAVQDEERHMGMDRWPKLQVASQFGNLKYVFRPQMLSQAA
ncbi:hypothetical protein KM043_014879 [Ampulex compressa]|nr:hypothetical protein KM043_014879 [Ampulex compressa]